MQLDLTSFIESHAHHTDDRAGDERMLEILALAESGMRFDCIDLRLGLIAGAAMRTWFDIRDACGDFITAH